MEKSLRLRLCVVVFPALGVRIAAESWAATEYGQVGRVEKFTRPPR